MTWVCPACGVSVDSGSSCPECDRDSSKRSTDKEVVTDGSGVEATPSDSGSLPVNVKRNIAAFLTALAAGYVGYEVVNIQGELLLPFPAITLLTFAVLVRKETPRKAVGTGLYIIAALLFLWTVHYTVYYQDVFAALAGPNLLFGVGAFIVVWMVLVAIGVAVLGMVLNRSAEN